ncbi:MAG TPA: Fur family transcriptional regulator [Thermoleophilaceae bacterium]|jgi:Fe2+ or Zn2+ uptake regulation protein|nr:Fur family transcriptional regulator [Thermoleophilaceae bacterium]
MESDQVLTEALRTRGQRVTLPRLMVHRFVSRAPQHVTAEDIHEELPSLSFATIYSTLELLEGLGLVRRVSTLEGVAVYDSRTDAHDHAVCRTCGRMFDLDPTDVPTAAAPAGFEVEVTQLQLVGTCADCAG